MIKTEQMDNFAQLAFALSNMKSDKITLMGYQIIRSDSHSGKSEPVSNTIYTDKDRALAEIDRLTTGIDNPLRKMVTRFSLSEFSVEIHK